MSWPPETSDDMEAAARLKGRKRYSVTEVFASIQGEGHRAGTPAVFVRFAGCNLWSGRDEDRRRDSVRHRAGCPLWCDTDFFHGERFTSEEILVAVQKAALRAEMPEIPLVVFTGGEPLLQLDDDLLGVISKGTLPRPAALAVETNGTIPLKVGNIDWVTVSPKTSPVSIKVRTGEELKVVYPTYDPLAYQELAAGFRHRFVSPQADVFSRGNSSIGVDRMQAAVRFCLKHPEWSLSIQQHKVIGIP